MNFSYKKVCENYAYFSLLIKKLLSVHLFNYKIKHNNTYGLMQCFINQTLDDHTEKHLSHMPMPTNPRRNIQKLRL